MNLKLIVFLVACVFSHVALSSGNHLPNVHNNSAGAIPPMPQNNNAHNPVVHNITPSNTNPHESNTGGKHTENEAPKKIDPKLQAKLNAKVDDVSEEQYQKIVAEYKQYLKIVPYEVRQEIRTYREEMAQLNKAKAALYKKLSQEAQYFLKSELEMKKRLPIKNKAAFSKDLRESNAE